MDEQTIFQRKLIGIKIDEATYNSYKQLPIEERKTIIKLLRDMLQFSVKKTNEKGENN